MRPSFAVALPLALLACSSDPTPSAPEGTRGGPCYGNGTCNQGLLCSASVCVLDGVQDAGVVGDDAGSRSDSGPGVDGGADDGGSSDGGMTRDAGGAPAPEGCFSGGPSVRAITRRAARIDSSGVAHVAFGGDALRYARRDANGWTTEVVDPRGDVATLALDLNEQPVIAYFDRYDRHAPLAPNVQALKVARRQSDGSWAIDTIDPELPRHGEELEPPQVVVLPSGAIFVAAPQNEGILTATYDGGWTTGTVDIGAAQYVRSLEAAVDVLGAPMLAFIDYREHYLIRNVGDAWRAPEVVQTPANAVGVSAFFADAAGRPSFVVYATNGAGERLHVLRETGAGWDVQTCAGFNNARIGYAPALLADGTPAFGFFDYVGSSGGWAPGVMTVGATCESDVADVGDTVRDDGFNLLESRPLTLTGIAFAADADQQLLVYLDPHTQEVIASRRDASGTWTREALSPNGLRGYAAALALDADDRPFIAGVELASRTLELTVDEGNGFVTEVVPIADPADECRVMNYVPGAVDVALHGTGDRLVAFTRDCPRLGRQVILSRRAPFGWTLDEVAPSASFASPLRLTLDPEGRPALVFDNRIAEYDGTQWVVESIRGLSGDGEVRPSLAYDGLGRAVVAHVEHRDVAVAFRDAAGMWSIERIEPTYYGDGMHTALAIDREGVYHLAYTKTTSNAPRDALVEVRYARKDEGAWTFETIEEVTSSTVFGSPGGLDIALVGDAPVVVFQSHTAQTARIARRGPNGWAVEDLVTDGDTGWFPSIAVDTSSVTHAAFHHRGALDLCYARAP